jgi:choline dehydrogenase-like flavoprotein
VTATSTADVLIIGAGPAGGVVACKLAQAGFSVVCLEQGEWPNRSRFRGSEPDWELARRKQWSWDPNTRRSPADYPVDLDECDPGTVIMNFNGVGGSTTLFAGIWPRFTPSDFRTRSTHGFACDWPISYSDLLPYYERTDQMVGVAGLGGNPAYPPGADPPLPPLPVQRGGLTIARAFSRLRWHWWPDTNAILSVPYGDRHPCVQRGVCSSGCQEGAKGSADLVFWAPAVAAGARVVTGARVRRIVLEEHGRACGAEWIDPAGVGHFQSADFVVCAANGIGTPRLLLASASPHFPDGLANRSGQVGSNLMFHPQAAVVGYFDEQLQSWGGHAGSWLGSWQFYEPDERRGFLGSAKWQTGPTGGPLAHAVPSAGRAIWGHDHHRIVAQRLGRGISLVITGEDLPNPANRVSLSQSLADSSGLAAPRITYSISPNSRDMMAWHCENARILMDEAGAHTIETVPMIPHWGHHMGTTRMGADPANSVVDSWCVAHDIPNLAIVDASVFVTSAGANPTTTICAIASRAGDHLIETRSRVPRPSHRQMVHISQAATSAAGTAAEPRPAPGTTATFTAAERARLGTLADSLIPAEPGRLAPSQAGIGGSLLDAFVAARPDLALPLHRALAMAPAADGADWVERIAASDPEARDAVELAVAGGYYLSTEVRRSIGYPGQEARPVRPDTYPEYIDEGLLDHLLTSDTDGGTA